MRNIVVIRAKANAHYTCGECSSTELIQAHHKIPGDDSSLIILCAECHSKRHPELPKALFFNKRMQSYWYNQSASSLAKELEVCSRTVIRAAKRLEIPPGMLNSHARKLLINTISKVQYHLQKPRLLLPQKTTGYLEARTKTLRLELVKTEKETARKEAEKLGISMSAFVRLLLCQWSDGIKFEQRTKENNDG